MDILQTFLFVPADSSRKMASARKFSPDAFIFDLEDAVAPDQKGVARDLLRSELDTVENASAKYFVRVNRYDSLFLEDDLRVAVHPKVYGIVVPKCGDAAEVARIHQIISGLEGKTGKPEGSTKLMLMIESAKGLARASDLARSSSRAIALLFGGEDFSADMGIQRTKGGEEIAVARSLLALAAKAERLEAIDGPFVDFNDAPGLFEEMRRVKQMGFSGKVLIHPNQIDVVQRALAPSPDEVTLAEEIIAAF
jgi:citrate lyase subunit beta/citryl-CoA lyase